MPKTYEATSKEIEGEVLPFTKVNEQYVATMKIQKMLKQGMTPERVLLAWNAGEGATRCSKGVNKYGVNYDSCAYIQKGLLALNR